MKVVIKRFLSKNLKIEQIMLENSEAVVLKNGTSGEQLSFWKDLSLTDNNFQTVNNVIEIPKGSFAKRQLIKNIDFHPLMNDFRKLSGTKVYRYFQMPVLFNYGFLPQTWEGNTYSNVFGKELQGDDDPVDTVEISGRKIDGFLPSESVVLGALGLIDQGEMDWKIIILNKKDSDLLGVRTLKEAQEKYGPLLDYIKVFFEVYKTHEKKKVNSYVNNGEYLDEKEALRIIKECQGKFQGLMKDSDNDLTARGFKLK